MKLQIDNLDGLGPLDYSSAIDCAQSLQVVRKLNQAAEIHVSLLATSSTFVVPARGARLTLDKMNGQIVFTGYVMQPPQFEYLGWGEHGPAYRYLLIAHGDEVLLNQKRLPVRSPFINRTAGDALKQLTQDLMPASFDVGGTQDVDIVISYASDPQKNWSQQAAEIAAAVRGSYRLMNGALVFSPVAATVYDLNETDAGFSPGGLTLQSIAGTVNDVTVIGNTEPQGYVHDYFIGDGLTIKFYLSQPPFTKTSKTLFDEEYSSSVLNPDRWAVTDPSGVINVSSGSLQVSGGNGVDGDTTVNFVEKVELGGSTVLQHGNVLFGGASSGIVGGLYAGTVAESGCVAGFQVTPNGIQSTIQAIIAGVSTGASITTSSGHHYILTTRIYSSEIYQRQQIFHSSVHPAGNGIGGMMTNSGVRIVLELQDIDPANPASLVAPSTVLYDGMISASSNFCTYSLINSTNLRCSVAFTRFIQAIDTEVRSALPGQNYITRLVGTVAEGAECTISSNSELTFFTEFAPAPNQAITVRYRGRGQALARVINSASVATEARGIDNGVHGAVRHVKEPQARTSVDCENAAVAILDDSTSYAWAGEYDCWSDFLPANAADIFPGDGLNINAASRSASFEAIVTEVMVEIKDLAGDHSRYKIKFANDAAKSLGFEFSSAKSNSLPDVISQSPSQVGTNFLDSLTTAEITQASSTTVTVDAGISPVAGGGIEVRWTDAGWGAGNDRNLAGRFNSSTFTLPRLARRQNYFLRQYDASVPARYSRFSAALYLDYPL